MAKKKFFYCLTFLIFGAIFALWFYQIKFTCFMDDQGRDFFIAKEIFQRRFVGLGPPLSINNAVHLPPLYYYILAAFVFLFSGAYWAGSVMVAALNLAGLLFFYFTLKNAFSWTMAALAVLIFGLSFHIADFSRFAANGNLLIFGSLIFFSSFYWWWKSQKWWWLTMTLVSAAVAVQMHTIGFLIIPSLLILWLWWRPKISWPGLVSGLFIVFCLFLPYLVYEWRYDFSNSRQFIGSLIHQPQPTLSARELMARNWTNLQLSFSETIFNQKAVWWPAAVFWSLIVFLVSNFFFPSTKSQRWWFSAAGVWLLLFTGFFLKSNFLPSPHYFIFIFPVIVFLTAALLDYGWLKGKNIGRLAVIILLVAITWFNFLSWQKMWRENSVQGNFNQQMEQAVDWMIGESDDSPMEIYLLSARENWPVINRRAWDWLFDQAGKSPSNKSLSTGKYFLVLQRPNQLSPDEFTVRTPVSQKTFGQMTVVEFEKNNW
ncbi:MAG: Uncharacterized protein CEN88_138 [Candidatus Berkelbacteria bacterium Licking1014_2]|uniref:Glycosyltransferase RgtA/B/C/D-like domain-containing protein n=1 Tax=Candidatus Berkelbacteria bacterium Licking1014_2 TaxID=2017146 RepID=A0A554LWE3_9BACT|nr:MAG: Uncharacterized protein CEN88_138 [Candidatus Berkelbacteria bacterium Licking1014_2]